MIFVDIETENFVGKDGSFLSLSEMKVTFAGAYDFKAGRYLSFWRDGVQFPTGVSREMVARAKPLPELEDLMKSADYVVGYNIWGFDYGVLSSYFKANPFTFPTLDLMLAMKKAIGFRPKLDSLAKANLGTGKIGKGIDAGVYWARGEYEKLEKYCLEDVRLTYEVWAIGEKERRLKYYDFNGFLKETQVDWRDGFMQEKDPDLQKSFF